MLTQRQACAVSNFIAASVPELNSIRLFLLFALAVSLAGVLTSCDAGVKVQARNLGDSEKLSSERSPCLQN
jgi:hypothetical protein